ncbi:MAG: cobyric acid synthase, partial [Rhodobacteraceae bacterium]|nr:cobyric acid synthase [Paracoccaceae bacterium]
ESFHRLASGVDLVIIEGAGSPAEVNLRSGDIANMGFAEAAQVPVILVGDIDRGGVIAQLVGTHAVLPDGDRNLIKGFIVNKFRGDVNIFHEGSIEIVNRTGWRDLGTLPWFDAAWRLPAEDVLDIGSGPAGTRGNFKVIVPRLNRIANFDDLDPLVNEPLVDVDIIAPGHPLPGDADLVLIPGSKSTIADLADFRAQGWDIDLLAHIRRGGHVLGLCGGYQMLGREIIDADGIEGPPGRVAGLGHLDVVTHMSAQKNLSLAHATYLPTGDAVEGYEIHLGETTGPDCSRGFLQIGGRLDGAASADGLVRGCYLHGLLASDAFRAAFLTNLGAAVSGEGFETRIEATLDQLADHIEAHLDTALLLQLAEDSAKPPN